MTQSVKPEMPELLPCPHCGGKAFHTVQELDFTYVVLCDSSDCLARGPEKETVEEAAAAWNTRPQEALDVEALKKAVYSDYDQYNTGFCKGYNAAIDHLAANYEITEKRK